MQSWKRTFLIIWAGQFASLLSSTLVNFAVIIWLSTETGSAEVLAYAAIAGLLPQSIIGLFSGVLVDRWDRKKTMMIADSYIAVCTIAISALLFFEKADLIYIYLLLGLRSVGSAFHMPAMQASIPLLAPESELLRIAGINQVLQSISVIGGPVLGALALAAMDISYVLLLDVAGALLAVTSLAFIHIPRPEKTSSAGWGPRDVLIDVKMGITAITGIRGLGLLFLFSVISTFCIMPVAVLYPLLTLQQFLGGPFHMSVVEMAWGVGMLIGGGVLGANVLTYNKVSTINVMYLIMGAMLSISGILPPSAFILFVFVTFVCGLSAAIYNACFTAIIQEKVNPVMLGRVFSMFMSITLLPSVLGLLGTGFLADTLGIGRTFMWLGFCVGAIGIISFMSKSLHDLSRSLAAPDGVESPGSEG